jgi:hypothetical protein
MIIKWKWFCNLIGVRGIILWPFIFVITKSNKVLLNHEKIHLKQANELFVIPFYIMYLLQYLKQKRKYKHLTGSIRNYFSYRTMPFEMECFQNQDNLYYLEKRERMAWKKYK